MRGEKRRAKRHNGGVRVYLDHNATSPMRPEVRELLLTGLDAGWGNPSSVHAAGRRGRARIDEARERTAAALGVHEDSVVFTSGGTEANNLALFGVLRAAGAGAGLVTSQAEHPSVLEAAQALAREGHPVAFVAVDESARPDLDALERHSQEPGCRLVSVMAANNEVGTVTDLAGFAARLGRGAREKRRLLHVDAVQALGRLPLELDEWGADLASFSAHKVGGPVGVGVLVRRTGLALAPLLYGGGQEGGLRAGTENPAAIAAGALAIELAVNEQAAAAERWNELASRFWSRLHHAQPDTVLLGPPFGSRERLPNTLNVRVPGVDGRAFVARLDLEGLEVSAGSACASGSLEPSHVLLAMGLDEADARAGLRMSFGRSSTTQDADDAVEILSRTVESLRTTP